MKPTKETSACSLIEIEGQPAINKTEGQQGCLSCKECIQNKVCGLLALIK